MTPAENVLVALLQNCGPLTRKRIGSIVANVGHLSEAQADAALAALVKQRVVRRTRHGSFELVEAGQTSSSEPQPNAKIEFDLLEEAEKRARFHEERVRAHLKLAAVLHKLGEKNDVKFDLSRGIKPVLPRIRLPAQEEDEGDLQ